MLVNGACESDPIAFGTTSLRMRCSFFALGTGGRFTDDDPLTCADFGAFLGSDAADPQARAVAT